MRFNYEVVKFTNGKYGARFFEVSLNRFGYSYIGTGKGGYLAYCKHLPKKENSYGFNIFFETKEQAKEIIRNFIKENTPEIRVIEVLK